jgi:hypothetical protein
MAAPVGVRCRIFALNPSPADSRSDGHALTAA